LSTLYHKSISEVNVTRFIEALESNPIYKVSDECKQTAIPFICQYVYPRCLNDIDYQLITREQCENIRDKVCPTEWAVAEGVFPGLLPNCELLDNNTLEDNRRNEQNFDTSCIDQFDEYCNKLCVPSCKHFSQYDEPTTSYRKAADIIAAVIALCGGTLFIIIAIKRRKNL